MSRVRKSAAAGAMAVTLIGGFEGLRQNAYADPGTHARPWTICWGHTADVKPGDRMTTEQCKALLVADADAFGDELEKCIHVPMPDSRFVALLSFSYNVGVRTACKSSVVRLINEGRTREGCDNLLHWNRAAGVVFPGLTKRRERERAFCLEGL
jgi:lysozyme